jgi:hypothetical protein
MRESTRSPDQRNSIARTRSINVESEAAVPMAGAHEPGVVGASAAAVELAPH